MTQINKEKLFEDYIKSCNNGLADRILEDIHDCKLHDKWVALSTDKEKSHFIDNSLMDPGIVKKYAHIKVEHQYTSPLYKHSWFTKSQLNLYENLSHEYKYPNDNGTKNEDGNKKSMTMSKIDDKFKQELINELKLKQFSNDQINFANQKNSILNKIKNKVNSSKSRNKDEDKQSLVDVKVHQIVPSKPKAPPPPPPTVKIKTTPLSSPVNETINAHVGSKLETDVNSEVKIKTNTTGSSNESKSQSSKMIHKPKKLPAPLPPAVHKPKQKDVKVEEIVLVDVSPPMPETIEYTDNSITSNTNLDSPTKSFCSLDDNVPIKSGFDFLDNW